MRRRRGGGERREGEEREGGGGGGEGEKRRRGGEREINLCWEWHLRLIEQIHTSHARTPTNQSARTRGRGGSPKIA